VEGASRAVFCFAGRKRALMAEQRLMKYNPAFLSDEELIATFAVRERELDSILEVLRENTGRSNQHVLLIGPRGIGKTTLVRRAAAEVRCDAELKAKWYPLVYAEESYGVSTPGEFWLEGILHLAEQTKDPAWQKTHEELRGERDEQRLCEKALSRLLDFADGQGKKILFIVENLNMLFKDQMAKESGWVLRQTLQHENRIMLLGTANRRFDEIEGIGRAWFEMFKIIELEPLSTAECRKIWRKATNTKLLPGRSKMLKILTGGNPRLLAILIQFAENMSLKALMDDLIRLVDEHTEYFKSHLDNLPGVERKVFASLAEIWDPATAREVAEAARLDVNKTSAFLNRLIEQGAVEAISVTGKRKKYQLVERMYNIYYLMRCRGSSSSRVQAAVRFMTSFYSPEEIGQVISILGKEACGLTPEGRRDIYQAYECLLEVGKTEEWRENIIKSIPKELFKFPDIPEQIKELGVKHVENEKKKEIQRLIDEFLTYMKKEDFVKMEEISSKLIEDAPNSAKVWTLRGITLVKSNKFDEAENIYHKAIELNHNYGFAWVKLGELLRKNLKRYEEAEKAYRKAIDIQPDNVWIWCRLGKLLHEKLKKYGEAENAYRNAIKIDSNYQWAWYNLGELLQDNYKKYEEAEKAYRKAIEIDPDFSVCWCRLGQLLHENLGRYDEAEKAYRKAIEKDSNFPFPWGQLGQLLHKNLERYEEAEQAYRKAIEINPNYAWPWIMLGQLLHEKLKKYEEAEEAYRKVIEIEPKMGTVRVVLIGLLLQEGKGEKAMEEAERGLDVFGRSYDFLNIIAEAFGLGDNKQYLTKAEVWSREAVEKKPGEKKYQWTLARILGCKSAWVEALGVMKGVMEDVELAKGQMKAMIDFYIGAAAGGHAEESLKVLKDSASADQFEPMIAGLERFITGKARMRAKEIEEVAADVAKRIYEVQKKSRITGNIDKTRSSTK
jgi:tetratricopeptide (TPR) repeat protein